MRGRKTYILLLLLPFWASAQKQIDHQQMMWYGYFNTLVFNEKWFLTSEVQERHFTHPVAQHQFILRTHLHRNLDHHWDIGTGVSLFYHQPGIPDKEPRLSIPEWRPHLELNFKQVLTRFQLQHRYRMEFRIFHNANADQSALEEGYTFRNLRFRYRLQAVIPLLKWKDNRALGLKLSDEVFIHAGENTVVSLFDQNRLYAGFYATVLPDLGVDIGYMKLVQQRDTGTAYYSRDIFRISVYHIIRPYRPI